MKKYFIIFVLTLIGLAAHAQTAAQLNAEGYKLFTKGDYLKSTELFKKAAAKDKSYVYAWYNLACACSKILEEPGTYMSAVEDGPCPPSDFDRQFSGECLKALEQAIKPNPDYEGKCRLDKDLAEIRTYIEFYKLLKYDFGHYADVLAILVGVKTWAIPGDGAFDPSTIITFSGDGTVKIASPNYSKTDLSLTASWFLVKQGDSLVVKFSFPENPYGLKGAAGVFRRDGSILLDPSRLGSWGTKQDGVYQFLPRYNSGCSA